MFIFHSKNILFFLVLDDPDTVVITSLVPDSYWIDVTWELRNRSGIVSEFLITYETLQPGQSGLQSCRANNNTFSTDDSADCKRLADAQILSQCAMYIVTVEAMDGVDPISNFTGINMTLPGKGKLSFFN